MIRNLFNFFKNSTCKDSSSYDEELDTYLRKNVPNWFIDTVEENKKKLLSLPLGSSRPSQKNSLGAALTNYIREKADCYDEDFADKIKKRFPYWFIDTVEENKKKLLSMPLNSERPNKNETKLGIALSHYLSKNGTCYDKEFAKKIKKKFPYWFANTAEINKEKLLSMPLGSSRPPQSSLLPNYTNKSSRSYDEEFSKKIKKKFPHWFIKSSDQNKKQLLAFPLGSKRPCRETKLGSALITYTCKYKIYDEEFTIKLKKRFPHWFRTRKTR